MPAFTKRNRLLFYAILALGLLYGGQAHAKFLLDEETTPKTPLEIKEAEKKQRREFPPQIVTSIRAQLIPNIKGAIRISWEADPDATEEFIVGRSSTVPDTRDKALAAISIKVVAPGADTTVIDSNLQPGEYYYVVLSKDRVMNRNVDVYPDVNFTTQPVIVERELVPVPMRLTPDQVTLIHAQVVNKSQVMVTWRGVDKPDIIYSVYRWNESLTAPDKIRSAEKIAVIPDKRESWIDRTITRSGTYFFAVTTKDISGNEDLQLIPDQSYTTGGVYIGFRSQATVSSLRAATQDTGRVKLTWDGIGAGASEYLVYRSDKPVVDPQRLALAVLLGAVKPDTNFYVDETPPPGGYYYAVLVRMEDGTIDNTLKEGVNCTIMPITIVPRGEKQPEIVTRVEEKGVDKRVPEKILPPVEERRQKNVPEPAADTLDEILKTGFFKGEYRFTAARLKQFVRETSDPYKAAKARLFIGRSYIELGEYERSIRYLVNPDVSRYFPDEARFWRDMAISRVK
ncbi:MAG: hypothetical protein EPN93_06710 [Spirochaetes bacterium]|nr:MAG: hypothetical protein EPN93_06710 [Spirochaetota bacterium]